jgi:hypothetical protein
MAFKALVSVGGYDFPEPSAYSGNTSTLVDSSRNVEGRFVGSVIRDDVSKIEISWKYLTVEQWARIQKCFRQSSGGKFINTVTFFDQSVGGWVTKEMYVNDRKANLFKRDPKTGDVTGWIDVSIALIEV